MLALRHAVYGLLDVPNSQREGDSKAGPWVCVNAAEPLTDEEILYRIAIDGYSDYVDEGREWALHNYGGRALGGLYRQGDPPPGFSQWAHAGYIQRGQRFSTNWRAIRVSGDSSSDGILGL